MRRVENTVKMTGILSFMYIMNTYDVWFTREGPVGSGDHRCLHVLESSRDQALEALRGERVRAVNVEFSGQNRVGSLRIPHGSVPWAGDRLWRAWGGARGLRGP